MARNSCLDCVRKHLAQAAILTDESELGYPHHRWFAVGHLAEAESESRREYPTLARLIRQARMAWMNAGVEPNYDWLIRHVCFLDGGMQALDLADDPTNSKTFHEPGETEDEFLACACPVDDCGKLFVDDTSRAAHLDRVHHTTYEAVTTYVGPDANGLTPADYADLDRALATH